MYHIEEGWCPVHDTRVPCWHCRYEQARNQNVLEHCPMWLEEQYNIKRGG
jgi:hypothetical protein